jgi:tetratricopeptide (TPR) repeat protein
MAASEFVFGTELSPDGGLLAAAGCDKAYEHGALFVWDAGSGRLVWSQKLPRPTRFVEFSPNGRILVTAANDDEEIEFLEDAAAIWDVATGQQKWVFRHQARVAAIGFHPTAPHLVTASSDRTVRLWNYETGQSLGNPLLHPRAVQDVAFIADGRFIASSTDQGDVRVWDPATGEPLTPWLPLAYHEYSEYQSGSDVTYAYALHGLRDREWNTTPAQHPLDDLVALSNLLASGTTSATADASTASSRWNAESFRETWQRLKSAYPEDFSHPSAAIVNWHQRAALAYTLYEKLFPGFRDPNTPSLRYAAAWHLDRLLPLLDRPTRNWLILRAGMKDHLGQPDAALSDYTAALEMIPRDSALLEKRAELWIKQGEYTRAKDDLEGALAILFTEHQESKAQQGEAFRYFAGSVLGSSSLHDDLPRLCLQQNDLQGYRKTCERLLELSRQDETSYFLDAIALFCVMSHQGFTDPERILAIAERAASGPARSAERLRTHGAALYRAGRFDEAAIRLEEALALRPDYPSAWLFLAMTEQQRGRPEAARQWFEKAAAWIEREQHEQEKAWPVRGDLDVFLLREAGELLISASAKD